MSLVKTYFYDLADRLTAQLLSGEVLTAALNGESSDFCRFNHGRVRQVGSVVQDQLYVRLIRGSRNAGGTVALSRDAVRDGARLTELITTLRTQLGVLPEDPHLLYATEVRSSSSVRDNRLPDAGAVVEEIVAATKSQDMVGVYAAGPVYRGFANSLGQRNWIETASFNLNWSFYERADKAVKTAYAGFDWDRSVFEQKVATAKKELEVLKREPRTIKPGVYRAYLSPTALDEIVGMLAWRGFGLKSHRTKQTPLLRMLEGGAKFGKAVTMRENTAGGIAPDFNGDGFIKPPSVSLIENGALKGALVAPRSAKEYGVPTNGADEREGPVSFEMDGGDIPMAEVAARIGQGLLINNLWYLNYSDAPGCRMTGMTRFATFWVEGGQIVAPVNVMRFDETLYDALGSNLIGLTKEREMIFEASTYGQRATGSSHLPGALVERFALTL